MAPCASCRPLPFLNLVTLTFAVAGVGQVYGGTIRAGTAPGSTDSLDIVSAFQAYGEYAYDRITEVPTVVGVGVLEGWCVR